jgi:hypothetical protein
MRPSKFMTVIYIWIWNGKPSLYQNWKGQRETHNYSRHTGYLRMRVRP